MTDTHANDSAAGARAGANGASADTSHAGVHDAGRKASELIEANPLGVLVGGLAVGALVAALLPRSEREKQMLAPVGKRVSATALAAFAAAKEVGRQELDSRGLTPSAAKDQARSLLQEFAKAAGNAGKAAAEAGREKAKTA